MANSCFFIVLVAFLLLSIGIPPCSARINLFNSITDQNALVAFKNSITITSDILVSNWTTNANSSFCSWIGVSCGIKHHQRVTAINLSGFGLHGIISAHLGNLTFLQSLDISYSNFSGSLPFELSKLRRLKEINVGVNSLDGEIPTWFGALPNLQLIQMNNNSFFGRVPPSLFNISSLLELNLRANSLSGSLPTDICNNTPNLRRMYLSGNQLEGQISPNIVKCRELEDLRIAYNHFNGNIPSEIWNLTMLTVLSLTDNEFQGGYDTMREIFNITSWAENGFHTKPIGLLNMNSFFTDLLIFLDQGVHNKFIAPSARTKLISANTVSELFTKLQRYFPAHNNVEVKDPSQTIGAKRKADSDPLDLSLKLSL